MGQAIKIGGIDHKRMIGLWTEERTVAKNGTSVEFVNPFGEYTNIIIEPFCETPNSAITYSVAIVSTYVSGSTIRLNFDKLENTTRFKCKVFLK